MRRAPVTLAVYMPRTEEGLTQLRERAAMLHSDFVISYLRRLPCPTGQKLLLLKKVIEAAGSTGE